MMQAVRIFVALGLIVFAMLSAEVQAACKLKTSTSDRVKAAIASNGGWPISDADCAIFNKYGLELSVGGSVGAANGDASKRASWAKVQVSYDNQLVSSSYASAMRFAVSQAASDDGLLVGAIEDAINRLDFEKAAIQVRSAYAMLTRKQMPMPKVASKRTPTLTASAAPARAGQPTAGNVVRCHTQCYNGDCLRTYEDGRRVRFQAQRKFNPFTNQWDYDSGTC